MTDEQRHEIHGFIEELIASRLERRPFEARSAQARAQHIRMDEQKWIRGQLEKRLARR